MNKPNIEDFWGHPEVLDLPPHGKLVLTYITGAEYFSQKVVIEDVALFTGIESSECCDWVEQFVQAGLIERATVLDVVL